MNGVILAFSRMFCVVYLVVYWCYHMDVCHVIFTTASYPIGINVSYGNIEEVASVSEQSLSIGQYSDLEVLGTVNVQ